MTARDAAARDTILHHHAELVTGVHTRVSRLSGAVAAAAPHLPAWADLVAFLADEILPHAAAEEDTLYPAAVDAGLTGEVEAMVSEHRQLERAIEALARTTHPGEAALGAQQIEASFTAHVRAENELVLPVLLTGDTSLADLLAAMHAADRAPRRGVGGARRSPDDLASELTTLLATALRALAEAGNSDDACRIAADTWAHLNGARPDLAARTTTLLHQLARRQDLAPSTPSAPTGDDDPELDVRTLAPARRHQVIFTAYHALRPSHGFVLVNDHDPKPLQYQFAAEHAGEFTWDYLQGGPRVWKVRIGKAAVAASV